MKRSESHQTGIFWFADDPAKVVPGYLDLDSQWPRIELIGALSAIIEETPSESPGVRAFGPAKRTGPRTIHGEITGPNRRLTLLEARSLRHTGPMMDVAALLKGTGLQQETLEGSYAILGAHIQDKEEIFSAIQFRITNQDSWTGLSGLEMQHHFEGPNKGLIVLKHKLPEEPSVELPDGAGRLSIVPEATVSPPRISGAYVLTSTWFQIEMTAGLTLEAASRRFVVPLSSLLTLLHSKDCPPTAIRVKHESSGRWCDVYSPRLAADPTDVHSPKLPDAPLLDREQLGLERIGQWFAVVDRLTPLPQLIAGAVDAGSRTVQNLLLELATAAEGIHRKLYPESRRISEEAKAAALQSILAMEVSDDVKKILHDAMQTYLWDLSYPMRLKELVADVAAAAPGVTGRTNKWSSAIVDARNGFAHWLQSGTSEDKLFAYHILHKSLRWLLVGRLLIEVGVPAEKLAERFTDFRPYQQFLEEARQTLPKIYVPLNASSQAAEGSKSDVGNEQVITDQIDPAG